MPFTFHVMAVLLVFRTVALNCRLWPMAGVADVGTTATLTAPLARPAAAWSGCLPRGAPNAQKADARTMISTGNLFRMARVIVVPAYAFWDSAPAFGTDKVKKLYRILMA
jgi:hypothetical protein